MDRALREKNATMLATGTQSILDSVAGLSEEQARLRPEPGRWSVLECIEHVILAENRMFELLTKQSADAASPDDGRREELFVRGSTNRIRKFEAPEFAKPTGRFPSLAAAVEEFRRCRARTEDYLTRCQDPLRSKTTTHPAVGPVSCQELVIIMALHPARHALQICEIRQTLGLT
jgi:uncharacterized damage-inducible protein DinB